MLRYSIFTRRRLLVLSPIAALTGLIPFGRPAYARHPEYSDNPNSRYLCLESDCTPHIYDPAVGDPERGFPPGTDFRDIPEDWFCPDCGAPKWRFVALD